MNKIGYKLPFDVTPETGYFLDSQSKKRNWLCNQRLQSANELKAQFVASDGQDQDAAKALYSQRRLRHLVPALKADHSFLKTGYSSPLKNTALRLTRLLKKNCM